MDSARRLGLFLFLSLLLLSQTLAFQVTPAAKTDTYAPTGETHYQLRLINDEGIPLRLSLSAEGEFADKVILEPTMLELNATEHEARVMVTLLHEGLKLTPGRHTVKIRVTAGPLGEDQFGGALTLNHNLNIDVPYAGAYLEGAFAAHGEEDGTLRLTMSLANKGSSETTAAGSVEIIGVGNALGQLDLGRQNVAPGIETKLEKAFSSPLSPGTYTAAALLRYDDAGREIEKRFSGEFDIGKPVVEFSTTNLSFEPGAIEGVSLPVEFDWNRPVEAEVRLTLLVDDEERFTMKSARFTLDPAQPDPVRAFVEVPEELEGEAFLRVQVHRVDGLSLGETRIPVTLLSGSVPLLENTSAPFFLLFGALIFLIVLAFFFNFRRGRR